ncbi:MAG: FAD-dependent oxidoreductase [Desulfobacteraceae bacterium]|jgi:NADH dehydrogenase FAD-containing subunit
MGKDLVLVGGGHAHMVTLANLHRFIRMGHRVTVIGPSPYHYYSGMGPGMLAQTYAPSQIRFATSHIVQKQGGRFVKDLVLQIDPDAQLVHTAAGATFQYDVVSLNTGSHVPVEGIEGNRKGVYTVKPIEGLIAAQQHLIELALKQPVQVAVIGGGAAGVEVAGNVWQLLSVYSRQGYAVRLFTRQKLMHRFPGKVRAAVMRSLQQRGIQLHERHQISSIGNGRITFKTGRTHRADVTFLATGVQPSPIFQASNLPVGPDGGLAVNGYLQCVRYDNIFGGGDCIHFQDQPLDKVGVYAVRQNPVLYHNLCACLCGETLKPFHPGGAYLLIFNMGAGTGVFYKQGVMLQGRVAFWIKDLIDRRFMRRFQAIERL